MTKETEILKRYDEARASWNEWRLRALEDLRFSNPAKPQQWEDTVIQARGRARPALVFDQTNQYINQVVNDARQNKPSIDVLPGDSQASDEAAEVYGGLVRQIEYASRSQIAYDTGVEYAARIGLGFILVVPELTNPALNDHEIRIKAVHNPLAVTFDPDSVEPDGQDADCSWMEQGMSEAAFKRRWRNAKPLDRSSSFYDGRTVKVCQYFERSYEQSNRIVLQDGTEYGEDEYHDAKGSAAAAGTLFPELHDTYMATTPKVMWQWWNGEEILEETVYPCPFIGLVPVYGNVLWIEDKRYICGMTRRMMDSQRAYNYERSAYIEAVALSPKAPFIGAAASVARYQAMWDNANRENRSFLPYDHLTVDGQALPPPKRQDPPNVGGAFMENAQLALADIQASVGMFKASLGQNSNAKSGVAINKLQHEGDTATYHYIDNESRAIEQVGRICVALIPSYMDRDKVARILKIDGKPDAVRINPKLQTAHAPANPQALNPLDQLLQVNPAIGAYDVRVKAGPSYTSLRQETTDKLVQMGQANPQLAAALAPLMLQMSDLPGADQAMKVAMALLPPQVQQAYNEDDGQPQVPPEMMQALQAAKQHIDQQAQMLQQLHAENEKLKVSEASKYNEAIIKAYEAETGRIEALGKILGISPQDAMALVHQVAQQALMTPAPMATMDPPGPMPPPIQALQPQPTPEPGPAPGSSFPGPAMTGAPPITLPAMAATGAQPGLGQQPPL